MLYHPKVSRLWRPLHLLEKTNHTENDFTRHGKFRKIEIMKTNFGFIQVFFLYKYFFSFSLVLVRKESAIAVRWCFVFTNIGFPHSGSIWTSTSQTIYFTQYMPFQRDSRMPKLWMLTRNMILYLEIERYFRKSLKSKLKKISLIRSMKWS